MERIPQVEYSCVAGWLFKKDVCSPLKTVTKLREVTTIIHILDIRESIRNPTQNKYLFGKNFTAG